MHKCKKSGFSIFIHFPRFFCLFHVVLVVCLSAHSSSLFTYGNDNKVLLSKKYCRCWNFALSSISFRSFYNSFFQLLLNEFTGSFSICLSLFLFFSSTYYLIRNRCQEMLDHWNRRRKKNRPCFLFCYLTIRSICCFSGGFVLSQPFVNEWTECGVNIDVALVATAVLEWNNDWIFTTNLNIFFIHFAPSSNRMKTVGIFSSQNLSKFNIYW